MWIDGLEPLQRTARRLRRRWVPGALVLAYHRVHAGACDPWSLGVSPENFKAHLEIIRRHARPASLDALSQALREGRRLPRRIVITFDDGYVDSLTHALPLLAQFEVPATVFIASAYLDQEWEFWWDELEQLLLHPGRLPHTLELNFGKQVLHWHLGGDAEFTAADFQRHGSWQAGGDDCPTLRHRAFDELHRQLVVLDEDDRRAVMDQIRTLAGLPQPRMRDGYRPLKSSEVAALDRCEWMDVGVHTRTHPQLDRMPIDLQRDEILGCKGDLEALLQRPIKSMAYPYGRYSSATPGLARELGFDCACTVKPGDVRADSDPYQINRVVACNWTGAELARRLGAWMDFA